MLRKFDTSSKVYDKIALEESEWKITQFSPPHSSDHYSKNFMFDYKNGDKNLRIYIREFDSPEKMGEFSIVGSPVNQGRVEVYKAYGEDGQKIFRDGFSSLSFRSGRFEFSIYCDNEETAERFAGYASEVLTKIGN